MKDMTVIFGSKIVFIKLKLQALILISKLFNEVTRDGNLLPTAFIQKGFRIYILKQ